MKSIAIKKCLFFFIVILASIIIHLLFFQVFIITIPLISETKKPPITFLGSILDQHVFSRSDKKGSDIIKDSKFTIYTQTKEYLNQTQSTFTKSNEKDIAETTTMKESSKKDVKFTFLEEEEISKKPVSKVAPKIDIPLEAAPYEPLTLEHHDRN